MVKVKVDPETCIACGVCSAMCPDVFEANPEDGKSNIVEQFRINGNIYEGEIPDDLLDCAKNAMDNCPTGSITIEE